MEKENDENPSEKETGGRQAHTQTDIVKREQECWSQNS